MRSLPRKFISPMMRISNTSTSTMSYFQNLPQLLNARDSHLATTSIPSAASRLSKSANLITCRAYQVERAYPQYSLFSDNCALVFKPLMPKFKTVGNGGLTIGQKGRLLLELSPANPNGQGYNWDEKINFALSVEDIGLMISQLPHYGISLARRLGDNTAGMNGKSYNLVSNTNETTEKIFSAKPGDGATILFKLDYVKDGHGGQLPPPSAPTERSSAAPIEFEVQAGEWEVVASVMKESLPYLVGWNQLMDISSQNAMADAEGRDQDQY